MKTEECGFFLHSSGILGATPDRLIGADGVLEVKTLPKVMSEGISIKQYVRKNEHKVDCSLAFDERDCLYLKSSHSHYHQVQGQMFITGRQHCIIAYWVPNELVEVKVQYDTEWEQNAMKLLFFYKEQFLPRLFSRFKY